jgi:hypothetical protein
MTNGGSHTPDSNTLLPFLLGFNKALLRQFGQFREQFVLPFRKNGNMLLPDQAFDEFL